ncbi:MAG: sodium:proton antiporter, partial [Pseudomonadota bacterium]
MDNFVLTFALIGVLGVGAQWAAWRFNLPAIVVMAIAGLVAGPVTGVLWPTGYDPTTAAAPPMETLFGDFYRPMIGMAVAVILFEGGLTLNFAELRGISGAVRRLIFPGSVIAWFFGIGAAHYIGGLTWGTAALFAGVMVVTGPTVIAPLLRQSRLSPRPAALLKWEGIVNDPLGALFAVLAYEVISLDLGAGHGGTPVEIISTLVLASILDAGLGFVVGKSIAAAFRRGWTAEYLKPPILLVAVLMCFEVANVLQEEGGLVAVTVMGVTLANARVASINELRLFKENVAVLLISGVFVILTANLTWGTFARLDWSSFFFLAAMLFIVRPVTVFLSTIGAGLPWQERLLIGWIAPRGIVAVAVTSFFAASLSTGYATSLEMATDPAIVDGLERSLSSAEKLIPLAFALVFSTVVLHGFTISPLAKSLKLTSAERPGVLISGASLWSVALARALMDAGIPVLVADASWRRLRPARENKVPTYYGELLSEVTEHHLDLNKFGVLLALAANEAHNALVCTDLAPEMGRAS